MLSQEPVIFVIDDDRLIRTQLFYLFKGQGFTVKLYHSPLEFLETYEIGSVGCIILDVRLPDISGLMMIEQLIAKGIHHPIIIYSGCAEMSTVVQAFKKGAFDFIEKSAESALLVDCVQRAIAEDQKIQQRLQYNHELVKSLSQLTEREWDVVNKVVEGIPNKIIADQLNISLPTVETHRKSVMDKLSARNLSHLVRKIVHGSHYLQGGQYGSFGRRQRHNNQEKNSQRLSKAG